MTAFPAYRRILQLARRALPRLALGLAALATALAAALPAAQPAEAAWHNLTGLLPATVDSVDFKISPNSRLVAFTADKDTNDVTELYVGPLTATVSLQLNPPLVTDGDVMSSRFDFTPDSQFIIYLADQEVDNRVDLYRVPVGGGLAVKLNPALVSGGNVLDFKIDPENARVIYVADQASNEVNELWSVPILGGLAVKLNGDLTTGGDIGIYAIDPLSDRVVYSADQETNDKFELYSVPIAGGGFTKLNPPIVLTGGGDSGIYSDWAIDPIIPVVVFTAREAATPRGTVYSIPTAGGSLTPLSFNMLANQRILSFKISPAGDRVIFSVAVSDGIHNSFKGNLYSNLIGAGGAANVSDTADPLFGTDNYIIMPDGGHVVYTFQNSELNPPRLESATMLGVRTPLYSPSISDPLIYNFELSQDSQWVAYQTGPNYLGHGMFTVPPGGGLATGHGTGQVLLMLPNSSRLVYLRANDADNHADLFSDQIFGGGERNLSKLFPAAYVAQAQASPNSQWIVFLVQINSQYQLRVTDGGPALPPLFMPLLRR